MKRTFIVNEHGDAVAHFPDILQTDVGRELYVGQERFIVKAIARFPDALVVTVWAR